MNLNFNGFTTTDSQVNFPVYNGEGNFYLTYRLIDEATGLDFKLADSSQLTLAVTNGGAVLRSNILITIRPYSILDAGNYNLALVGRVSSQSSAKYSFTLTIAPPLGTINHQAIEDLISSSLGFNHQRTQDEDAWLCAIFGNGIGCPRGSQFPSRRLQVPSLPTETVSCMGAGLCPDGSSQTTCSWERFFTAIAVLP